MTDTHCHLYLAGDFPGDECCDAMTRAIASGVTRMVFPNVDRDSLEPMRRLHEVYPFNSAMAIGIHPTELHGDWEALLDEFEQLAASPEFVAIGEVGIDLHFDDNPPLETQRRAFARHLDWAVKYDKPVIIHCRDARDEVLQCIVELRDRLPGNAPLPRLVFHSFTGTPDDVRAIRRVCDPMFGINGVVTFKNAPDLREALHEIGPDRMLLETDAPWLAPVPHRGQRNESAYIPLILNRIAEELKMPADELERITDSNATSLFF